MEGACSHSFGLMVNEKKVSSFSVRLIFSPKRVFRLTKITPLLFSPSGRSEAEI